MFKMKFTRENFHYTVTPETRFKEFEIEAETEDKLFALYFKEYKLRYTYCNYVFEIQDKEMDKKYRAWIAIEDNYFRNGGDSW